MRILIGPNPETIPLHIWPAGGDRYEVLQLANRVPGEPAQHVPNSWADMLSRCPDGWTPDVYLCWSFEYRPIPEGIEDADCFTVGVIGDWNLGGQAFHHMGGAFDLLVADRRGSERLRAAGFENVVHWPLWAYDPKQHYRMKDVERDLDVVMIGNFNHEVQRGRAPWLARIARLSRRHRVVVASGIFGEDYTRALNRARIVFNRSIRGEINMRAYEAAACGALMFYERENEQIGRVFQDREECVLYGEDDLEELIDYYLEHEDERARIAEAGSRAVAPSTYPEQAAGLFDLIATWRDEHSPSRQRSAKSAPRSDLALARVQQWLTVLPASDADRARQLLDEAHADNADTSLCDAIRACLMAERSRLPILDQGDRTAFLAGAIDLSTWVLRRDPALTFARVNRAEMLRVDGQPESAAQEYRTALDQLSSPSPVERQVCGPYFPRAFDAYTVELERLWTEPDARSPEWRRRVADLLSWQCRRRLAEIALADSSPVEAVHHARVAASLQPDLSGSWLLLARCHRAAGELAEAVTAYQRAYELVPMDPDIWQELLAVLHALGARAEILALTDDLLAIIDGCPNLQACRGTVERFAQEASRPLRPIRALFAAPNWRAAEEWQPVLAEFARAFRGRSDVTLTLLVDERQHPDMEFIVHAVQGYLSGRVDIPESEWPDLHLLQQTLDALELTVGAEWIEAIMPPPLGPRTDWQSATPRMTVHSFQLAVEARRPLPARLAA